MTENYEFIDYNDTMTLQYTPEGSLANALLNMADGTPESVFLNDIYFTTDPNVVVVAPKNGPWTSPQSKFQERFTLNGYSLEIQETFDGGETWDPTIWVDEDIVGSDANDAADFIREWIVTA